MSSYGFSPLNSANPLLGDALAHSQAFKPSANISLLAIDLVSLISEECTGNIAKRRHLVNPYGPEIQTEFYCFIGDNDLNLV